MRKLISFVAIGFVLFSSVPARADIFGGRSENLKMKASEGDRASASFVDPGTVLDYGAAIIGYLGARAGSFYDIKQDEFTTLLSATIYTIPDSGIAFNVGMTNADGILGSIEYNVGANIPSEDVPLLNMFQYLYIGFAAGERYIDINGDDSKSWEFAYGPTVSFKTTF